MYYADIAAGRAVARVDEKKTAEWFLKLEDIKKKANPSDSSNRSMTEAPRLMQCVSKSRPDGTKFDMWYI